MAGYPPPYPPYGDVKYQRRMQRDQARAQRDQMKAQLRDMQDQRRAMRRGSIVGPVLVVAVGIVFLLSETGHLHNERIWEVYGHWWPLLLVVAGFVMIGEWVIDRSQTRNPDRPFRRSIGGGVIALLILLALAGGVANGTHQGTSFFGHGFSINGDNIDEFLGDKHESDESFVKEFPAGGTLTIDDPHGDVTVSGTSPDAEIHIALHKEVYSRSDSDAEQKARELSPQLRAVNGTFAVILPNLNGAVTNLTITLPAAATVNVTANHGDVHVDTLQAPVTITANHGDVALSGITAGVVTHMNNSGASFSAHNITGSVTLHGRGDDVTVSGITGPATLSGDFYGTTHLEHIAGAVRFHTSRTDFQLARLDGEVEIGSDADLSASQAVGPVVLTTRDRNINLDRISGDLSVTNRNGSVDLISAPPMGNVTVENRNGSVTLTLPEQAAFAVNAETKDGEMQNDFSLPSTSSNSRNVVTGTVGKGGPMVRINNSQGDVSIRKASVAPLPPSPPTPPALAIKGDDGSSVYVGKGGVRVISGTDGGSVIIGNGGVRITGGANGSSVYTGKDGTHLTSGADGSKVLIGHDGTHYTVDADGSKAYAGVDGSAITIDATGHQAATGSGGRRLTDAEVRNRLRHADEALHRAEQQRDAEQAAAR